MEHLVEAEVLLIHHAIIEKTGGSHGVRDLGLFASILERPKGQFGGQELYPDIFQKAAVYLEGYAKFHVFIDGNKRTAFASAVRFLYKNGVDLSPTNKEVERFMVAVVEEKLDIEAIAVWVKKHSKKGSVKTKK